MSEQEQQHHPYDSAFKTLIAACAPLLIPLVNELFGTTFSFDDKVVLLDATQMQPMPQGKIKERELDSLFAIGSDRKMTFHIECQSKPDDTMSVRLWEYDAHVAMRNAEISNDGRMRVRFPRSAVMYLRHNANTPDRLVFETENDRGDVVEIHELPVVKTQMYELDDLLRKELLFLFPFYAFKHEKRLREYNTDAQKFEALREDIRRMIQKLDEARATGRIDGVMARTIVIAMTSVLHGLGEKYDHVMKGVDEMLSGTLLKVDAIEIHDKAWDEGEAKGRAEGRAEGKLEMLFDLVDQGQLTEDVASASIRMPIADFKQRMAEYNRVRA